mgnify:CR=1 FL=1
MPLQYAVYGLCGYINGPFPYRFEKACQRRLKNPLPGWEGEGGGGRWEVGGGLTLSLPSPIEGEGTSVGYIIKSFSTQKLGPCLNFCLKLNKEKV